MAVKGLMICVMQPVLNVDLGDLKQNEALRARAETTHKGVN